MAEINKYLQQMVKVGASDLHLASGYAPICRVNGELRKTKMPPMPPKVLQAILKQVIGEERFDKFVKEKDVVFSYEIEGLGRFRGSAYYHHRGLDAVIRHAPERIPPLSELGFPPAVDETIGSSGGLILLTGPGGSGKSTTAAAVIERINERRSAHIITLEPSIEFVHRDKSSIVNQREIGRNARSYLQALQAALKQDPDVILIGEMRDHETVSMAMTASENGLLVFGVLHTRDAQSTLNRVINIFPEEIRQQAQIRLARSLILCVSQRLLPRKDGKGRVMACEVLVPTKPISQTIREGKTHQIESGMQMNRHLGNKTIDDSVIELFESGKITYEAGLEASRDKKTFQRRFAPPAARAAKT